MSSDGDPVCGTAKSMPWTACGPLAEPRRERVGGARHLPERPPRIVAFERHDHEVTHRGRLQERSLVDAGPSSGVDELLVTRAVQLRHPGAPLSGLSRQDRERDCHHRHGNLHGHVRARRRGVGLAIGPARRSWRPCGDAALVGTRRLPCLPPMQRVCATRHRIDRGPARTRGTATSVAEPWIGMNRSRLVLRRLEEALAGRARTVRRSGSRVDLAGRDGERQQGAKSGDHQDHAATAPSATRRRHRHVTRCPREQVRPELTVLTPPATNKVIPEHPAPTCFWSSGSRARRKRPPSGSSSQGTVPTSLAVCQARCHGTS